MTLSEHKKAYRILSAAIVWTLVVTFTPVVSAQNDEKATVTIDGSKVFNSINPLLYGQFLEHMFQGVKYGLDAELIRDRSFEETPNVIGLPRYWERYPDDRVDDYAISFLWDDSFHYPQARSAQTSNAIENKKEHAIRVDAGNGVIKRHGFFQSAIPVRAGHKYRGYLWLRTTSFSGKITVALESNTDTLEVYCSADLRNISGDWRKYEFSLLPEKTDMLARLSILFEGVGRVWVDQASLVPDDASAGNVRQDVFGLVKDLKPAFIRWPGGNVAQDYHWQWGVGPRDSRPVWTNLSWKNDEEPSEFGTDEFISFARAVGAEPSITVNVEGRGATVEEAAAWVEYCNGPADSKYGALRAANGHPASYGVKYWEIGNEIWGEWVRGHSDAETYARNLNRYAAAMRAVDPTIKLIAVGDNNMAWNRTILQSAGSRLDYLAVHHYYGRNERGADPLNLMARPLHYAKFYENVAQLLAELGLTGKVQLAVNEWGLDVEESEQYSMSSALYAARLMNVFERSSKVVGMSAVSDLVNGWPGGIIQSGRQSVFVSSVFLVNKLYASHLGKELIDSVVAGPTFDTSKEGKGVPELDVVSSRSSDQKELFIKAVNTRATKSMTVEFRLNQLRPGGTATIDTVLSPTHSFNSFAHPDDVIIKRSSVTARQQFTVSLPAASVSVINVKLGN